MKIIFHDYLIVKRHMLKKWFLILFTMLFVLQTTAAVMDEYQPHDENESPFAFDHGHDSEKPDSGKHNTITIKMSSDGSVSLQLDNHHCCHCHTNSQFSSCIAVHLYSKNQTNEVFEYSFIYPSIALSLKLRPPKV